MKFMPCDQHEDIIGKRYKHYLYYDIVEIVGYAHNKINDHNYYILKSENNTTGMSHEHVIKNLKYIGYSIKIFNIVINGKYFAESFQYINHYFKEIK